MEKIKTELKWAFIFMGFTLAWMWMEKLVGLHSVNIQKHAVYTMFFVIPAILLYALALRDKKANYYGGNITYKESFLSGMTITLIVTLFSPITQWIISTIISPDFFDNIIAYSVRTGYYKTPEAAAAYFNLKNYIIQSATGAMGMGILTSAITSLFIRNKKP